MVTIPKIVTGRPKTYAWGSVTTRNPMVLTVDTEKEAYNIQQAASRYAKRHGLKFVTRTERIGGKVRVTVYKGKRK